MMSLLSLLALISLLKSCFSIEVVDTTNVTGFSTGTHEEYPTDNEEITHIIWGINSTYGCVSFIQINSHTVDFASSLGVNASSCKLRYSN